MKQTTTKEKISHNKSLTDNKAIMFFKDLLRLALSLIAGFRVPYQVVIEQPCRLLPDKPVIYAVNHSYFADTPIIGRINPKRSYILLGKQWAFQPGRIGFGCRAAETVLFCGGISAH